MKNDCITFLSNSFSIILLATTYTLAWFLSTGYMLDNTFCFASGDLSKPIHSIAFLCQLDASSGHF